MPAEDAKRQRTDSKLARRLAQGPVICAEGYLFELERRGFVQIGPFVPDVTLEHPEVVKGLHREFLRAGSDVIEAFTYYAHRSKMRLVGKEDAVERINRKALQLAKEVAAEGDALVAGNVCNTCIYIDDDQATHAEVRAMFEEQVRWAAEAGVDFVIGETFDWVGEALIAVEVIKRHGLPPVITFAIHKDGRTRCGKTPVEACRAAAAAGAAVVGLNCARGPATMLPLLADLATADLGVPLAALPVAYRTSEEHPTFQSMSTIDRKYCDLDPHTCTRYDFADFAEKATALGVRYIGTCCGGAPHHVRAIAERLGRRPPASANSPDLSKHFVFGTATGVGTHSAKDAKAGYLSFKEGM